jgi:PDZ domain-containing secreted protein
LTSDSEIYDEAILLKDFKDKMFWDLQKTLTSNIYKITDLYEFARLCQFIDQILRNVNNKTRNFNRDDYEESISRININNQESSRDQNTSKSRSQTSASFRVINQASMKEQVNAFSCYNCEKFEHLIRNCKASKKLNSNNFVREIEKNVFDNDDQIESRKE